MVAAEACGPGVLEVAGAHGGLEVGGAGVRWLKIVLIWRKVILMLKSLSFFLVGCGEIKESESQGRERLLTSE